MTMTTLARSVTGGVDTHLDVHVVAALDEKGTLLGVEAFETTRLGYKKLLAWLEDFGPVTLVGIEGTSSYGAGLTRHLHAEASQSSKSTGRTVSAGGARASRIPKTPSRRPGRRSAATPAERPRPRTETSRP
jgi:transposase